MCIGTGSCWGCGSTACICGQGRMVRNKVGNCPHCGAGVYESTYYPNFYGPIWYCPKPTVEYTCSCRWTHCQPAQVIHIHEHRREKPKVLSKKKSNAQW